MEIEYFKNPKACASPKALRSFLRASRQRFDDQVHNKLTPNNCGEFLESVMHEWAKREEVLSYCESLLKPPPEADSKTHISDLGVYAREQVLFKHTQTDPRVDSYGSRNELDKEAHASVAVWLENERATEAVVRDFTKEAFQTRCGPSF